MRLEDAAMLAPRRVEHDEYIRVRGERRIKRVGGDDNVTAGRRVRRAEQRGREGDNEDRAHGKASRRHGGATSAGMERARFDATKRGKYSAPYCAM